MTAPAQTTPTYKLVDLGTLGNQGDEDSREYGVNAFGEVVGESGIDGETIAEKGRAYVWLPEARLGLPQGMTSLGVFDEGPFATSRADHVNDFLHVVGTDGGTTPFIWTPVSFDQVTALTLHSFSGLPPGLVNVAWQITNDPGPHQWVVGERGILSSPVWRGFIWKSELPDQVIVLEPAMPPPGGEWNCAGALAINPTGVTGSLQRVAGYSVEGVSIDQCPQIVSGATEWLLPVVNGQSLPVPSTHTKSASRDVTDLTTMCGWWQDPGAECLERAMFWGGASVVDLHFESELPTDEKSFAEALNTSPEVVGWRVEGDAALLWRLDVPSSGWVVTDLNDEIGGLCTFRLQQAHDVSEEGWIVGVGDADPEGPEPEIRAFLLIPFEDLDCLEDVDRDGDVDQDDLDLIINASNQPPCDPGRICWEDVNGDCVVNKSDIKSVMLAFGPCGGTGTGLSAFDVDTWMEAGGSILLAEEAIGAPEIGTCLEEPTVEQRFVSLFVLLGD